MGQKTNLKSIYENYLTQLLNRQYSVVDFDSSSTFYNPRDFLFEKEYDFIEEVDKTLVCQWLDENGDYRFSFYVSYYLKPNQTISIKEYTFAEVFSLISPHNVSNSESNLT